MSGIFQMLLGAVQSIATDAYFYLVTLLLPGNGTNGAQNNTFLDSSTNNFTITRNGNTTQGTFSPFSQANGYWGNYFNGSDAYLTVAQNSAFSFGTGAFCVEAFIYTNAVGTSNYVMQLGDGASGGTPKYYCGWSLSFTATALRFYRFDGTETLRSGSATFTAGQWYHVVACRDASSNFALFVDGTRVLSQASATTSYDNVNTNALGIGSFIDGDPGTRKYTNITVSNARIVKGSTPYDPTASSFTVPTSALTAITNTSLLTCQSNRFIDNSSNAFTITTNGSPSVQQFCPFNPTAAWSASTNGGSGYFDGTGDYLSLASNAAWNVSTNSFTVECWIYPAGTQNGSVGLVSAGYNNNFHLQLDSQTSIYFWIANQQINASSAIKLNQWNWVVAARGASNAVAIWVNGTRVQSGTLSGTGSQQALYVGTSSHATSTEGLTGYMSGAKFVNGTDVYGVSNTTITVPTAPPTDTTNTKLLTNFTNAGIYDAATKNDLETVADAKISTTQSKWGGSSMYFDGTGDRLSCPTTQTLTLGGGDFTVEAWIYKSTDKAYQTLCGNYYTSGENTWQILADDTPGTKIGWFNSASTSFIVTSASTLSTSTWYHIAFVRSGSTLTLYINGTSDASATLTTNYNTTTRLFMVGQVPELSAGRDWNGYIQDLRITKGYARYTANFTAPTAAFPLY